MEYRIKGNKIIIENADTFEPKATLTSGQMFRFGQENGTWYAKSADQMCKICDLGANSYEISCSDPNFFVNYFDFARDYDIILKELGKFPALKAALEYGRGIRMLRQPLFEPLICFIISANNNIPRIRKSVEGICARFGTLTEWGHAFPTLEQLTRATEKDFEELHCGYRAAYLVKTIRRLCTDFDISVLENLPTDEAREMLMTLPGIGPKVADCVLLFGLHRYDVFPVDVWIDRVYHTEFGGELKDRKAISEFFVDMFGELSGFCQQYLFYYKRKDINLK